MQMYLIQYKGKKTYFLTQGEDYKFEKEPEVTVVCACVQ